MARDINDNPGGWTRSLPGHTVEYESGFALPFYEGGTVGIAAGASGTFTLSITNTDWIYFADMVSVTPQAFTEFFMIVYVNDVPYVAASGQGWLNIPLRQNPSIQLIAGDHIDVVITNLDASSRNFLAKVNGTKIVRPASFGHAPGAYFTASPVIADLITPVVFTDGSSYTPTEWEWDLKDGLPVKTTQNVTKLYTAAGKYSPKLVARNAYGWDSYAVHEYIDVRALIYWPNYTEVDTGSKISLLETYCHLHNVASAAVGYCYKDFGANYFHSFDVRFMIRLTAVPINGQCQLFGFSNAVGNGTTDTDGRLHVCFYRNGAGAYFVVLRWRYTGGLDVNDVYQLTSLADHYVTLKKDYSSDTAYLYVYSDINRTVLVDTLVVTHATMVNMSFRYCDGVATFGAVSSAGYDCVSASHAFASWS